MNVSDKLADEAVERQINLQRYAASLRKRVIALLNETQADIIEQIRSSKELTSLQKRAIDSFFKEILTAMDEQYAQINTMTEADLVKLASVEATWQNKTLLKGLGVDLATQLPSPEVLEEIAKKTLIQGAVNKTWWSRQSQDAQFRFLTNMRIGISQSETNGQLIKRVRAISEPVKRNAEALVRTSVQTISGETRRSFFKKNDDIVAGIQQVSTLDTRTSLTCIAYSGATWDTDYKPIRGNKLAYNGGVPRHWNCRSVEIPITKTFKELGLDIDEVPASTRASMDGKVAADLSFNDFLKRRSTQQVDNMLGKGRADLWRGGKITLQDLVGGDGMPLTLAELDK